jgi:hypothetical protein
MCGHDRLSHHSRGFVRNRDGLGHDENTKERKLGNFADRDRFCFFFEPAQSSNDRKMEMSYERPE